MDMQIIYTNELDATAVHAFVHEGILYVMVNKRLEHDKDLIGYYLAEIVRILKE